MQEKKEEEKLEAMGRDTIWKGRGWSEKEVRMKGKK